MMTEYYHCRGCSTVRPLLIGDAAKKCASCGKADGYVISQEQFEKSFKAGAFFNVDPRTGKRAKTKR